MLKRIVKLVRGIDPEAMYVVYIYIYRESVFSRIP